MKFLARLFRKSPRPVTPETPGEQRAAHRAYPPPAFLQRD